MPRRRCAGFAPTACRTGWPTASWSGGERWPNARRQERIPGKTLYDRLGGLPLPYEEARGLAGKIAAALADLHRQNAIHHDIKPSSIMFRRSGECVLIDFGLSHHNQLPDLLQEEFRLPIAA
jgi:serine/threonine protein kinase